MSKQGDLEPPLRSYLDVATSFVEGLLRIWGAEAASARLMCALVEFHGLGGAGLDGPGAPALDHLARIPFDSYDALAYVTNVSHLVYATSLLDTFISDTTLFLFLLIPKSMGKNQQIPLRTIIEASSRNDALTLAASGRTREISYLPFPGRIDFLRDTFGLALNLSSEETDALMHYSSVRNTAVHDQGIYELGLDENGSVVSRKKACPRHPTSVSGEDVHKAIHVYDGVAREIACAVFTQVLKAGSCEAVQSFIKKRGRQG